MKFPRGVNNTASGLKIMVRRGREQKKDLRSKKL
jgi:hypothetical protein